MSLPKMKAAVLTRLDRPLDIVSEIELSAPGRGKFW